MVALPRRDWLARVRAVKDLEARCAKPNDIDHGAPVNHGHGERRDAVLDLLAHQVAAGWSGIQLSSRELGSRLGCSARHVRRIKAELEASGLLCQVEDHEECSWAVDLPGGGKRRYGRRQIANLLIQPRAPQGPDIPRLRDGCAGDDKLFTGCGEPVDKSSPDLKCPTNAFSGSAEKIVNSGSEKKEPARSAPVSPALSEARPLPSQAQDPRPATGRSPAAPCRKPPAEQNTIDNSEAVTSKSAGEELSDRDLACLALARWRLFDSDGYLRDGSGDRLAGLPRILEECDRVNDEFDTDGALLEELRRRLPTEDLAILGIPVV